MDERQSLPLRRVSADRRGGGSGRTTGATLMLAFSYARAASVTDALTAGAAGQTAFLAGGTELLNWLRLGVSAPERVLDIGRLDGLDAIETSANGALVI